MNERFMFRLPFYNNKGEFSHFEFILIGESLPAYNAGVMHNNNEYEQCTGLTDKNGNLIYEGDIIFDGYCKRVVKWGGWCWHAESKSAICPLDEFTLRESEIIGNIHEQAKG